MKRKGSDGKRVGCPIELSIRGSWGRNGACFPFV